MQWHFNQELPIYSQLVDGFRQAIAAGVLAPGARLSSVRDLSLEAGVNPNTMQRAMQQLEREGFVHSQRSLGRFVTEDTAVIDRARETLAAAHVRRYREAMRSLGFTEKEMIALLESGGEEEENGDLS